MWYALRSYFGSTPITRYSQIRCVLIHKFIAEHLRKMPVMTCDPNAIRNVLSEEQQTRAVLHALPKPWDFMKLFIK